MLFDYRQQGRTGWDQSHSHKTLVSFLNSAQADELGVPREGRALVPGCGKGYDVALFASRGLHAIGLDLAPTGVEAAQKWIALQAESTLSNTEVICQDFFAYDPKEKFDVIYDYTFLCALPPDLHPRWAAQFHHLTSPASLLITMMYPLPPTSIGQNPPPWPLTVDRYHELLDKDWVMVWSQDVPDEERRTVGAPGGEKLAVWRRRST
ncbi:hypothetical protein I317_03614 [Kwoniella heveanensis CBS 569]|nr:hypothetical protein I317_03614 [Kwoniella heveanensis CBS 569]